MKRTIWFVLAAFALLLVASLLLISESTPPASAQSNPTPQPELVAIWRKAMDDQNKGDVASVLTAFTDDAVLSAGGNSYAGKAAIQKYYEGTSSTHTQVDIVVLTGGAENVLQVLNEVRGDTYKARGFERIVTRGTITFTGNKVSRVVVTGELSDPQTAAFTKLQQADPETIYRKMIDDLNKADIPSVVATFTDDAVLIGSGCPEANPCVGKAGVQKFYEQNAAIHARADLLAVTLTGNTLQVVADARWDGLNALGAERYINNATVTFTGNKISRVVIVPEPSDPQTMAAVKARQAPPTATPVPK